VQGDPQRNRDAPRYIHDAGGEKTRKRMSRAEPDSAPRPAIGMGCFPARRRSISATTAPTLDEMNPPSRDRPDTVTMRRSRHNELPGRHTRRSVLEQNKIVLREPDSFTSRKPCGPQSVPRGQTISSPALRSPMFGAVSACVQRHHVEPSTMDRKRRAPIADCGGRYRRGAMLEAGSEPDWVGRRARQHGSRLACLRRRGLEHRKSCLEVWRTFGCPGCR